MQTEYWNPDDYLAGDCAMDDIGKEKLPVAIREYERLDLIPAQTDESMSDQPRRRGRPPNKDKEKLSVEKSLRLAFEALGGVRGLVEWGRQHPTQFYQLTGKLIPQEMKSQVDAVLTVVHALPPTKLDEHNVPEDERGEATHVRQLPPSANDDGAPDDEAA